MGDRRTTGRGRFPRATGLSPWRTNGSATRLAGVNAMHRRDSGRACGLDRTEPPRPSLSPSRARSSAAPAGLAAALVESSSKALTAGIHVTFASRLVAAHSAVARVEFAGSRSRGTHDELSDWDFAVETSNFAAVARDMPELVAPLEPLGQQWEPLGHFPAYQLLMRGPIKVEYLLLNEAQDARPPTRPGPETLSAINAHFWAGPGG